MSAAIHSIRPPPNSLLTSPSAHLPCKQPGPAPFSFPANGFRAGPIAVATMACPIVVEAMAGSTSGSLSLPDIPDLSPEMKEKILCLELMGIDSGRAMSLNPDLRTLPLSTLQENVSYLLSRGLMHKDLARVFGVCPAALTLDVSTGLAPVFRFLTTELGVPARGSGPRKTITKCPRLLVCSVHEQLRPTLVWLLRLGFKDTLALAYNDPILLASSVERTLKPKLDWLAEGLGLGREGAVAMVLRCPGLFTFSIENNLMPKAAYFVDEMKRDPKELSEFPQYFSFSLEKRIMPRHQRIVDCGADIPLPDMLKATDEEFEQLLQGGSKSGGDKH